VLTTFPLAHVSPLDGAGEVVRAFAVLVPASLAARVLVRRTGRRGRARAVSLLTAAALVVVALSGPVERLAGVLLTGHMIQHLLLMSFAAPLVAWALPPRLLPVLLPEGVRGRTVRAVRRRMPSLGPWVASGTAVAIATVTLWTWHVPALYEAAIRVPLIHGLEHLTLFATALMLWWVVIESEHGGATGRGLLVLFVGAAQATGLGALIAFSGSPWYGVYAEGPGAWGLTPIQDQQLAGLLMWSVGGLVAVVVGVLMTVAWLQRERPAAGVVRNAGLTPTSPRP
jgi:putative membrane protein